MGFQLLLENTAMTKMSQSFQRTAIIDFLHNIFLFKKDIFTAKKQMSVSNYSKFVDFVMNNQLVYFSISGDFFTEYIFNNLEFFEGENEETR